MDTLGKLIESITKPRYEEDGIDRLNYRVTSYMLLLAAFTIIAKEYGGDPIQCWMPAELAQRGWEQFTKDYCFVESTYFAPIDPFLGGDRRPLKEKKLTYYQWVPFVLLFQALMFTIPHIFWRMLNWTTGIHTRAVITMASNATTASYDSKEMNETVEAITKHLDRTFSTKANLIIQRISHSNLFITAFRIFASSRLTILYILMKLLFIGNGILQFWLLSYYLGSSGLEQTIALFRNQSWRNTGLFPRVTFCDLQTRMAMNRNNYTIQCVLMANMFNEKIFIGLWWWILILLTFTCMNSIYWLFLLLSKNSKMHFLRGLVQLGRQDRKMDIWNLRSFMSYLGGDGILVFRLMTQNAGDIVSSLVIAKLFDKHVASVSRPMPNDENDYNTFDNKKRDFSDVYYVKRRDFCDTLSGNKRNYSDTLFSDKRREFSNYCDVATLMRNKNDNSMYRLNPPVPSLMNSHYIDSKTDSEKSQKSKF